MCVVITDGKAVTKKMIETEHVQLVDWYVDTFDDNFIILFISDRAVCQARVGSATSLLLGE